MKRLIIILFFLLVNAGTIWSQQIKLTKTSEGYTYNFKLPEYNEITVDSLVEEVDDSYRGKKFTKLLFKKSLLTAGEIGKAELPIIEFNIVIPNSTNIPSLEVNNKKSIVRRIANYILPKQISYPRKVKLSEKVFSFNEEYYQSQGKRSTTASIVEVYEIRGITFAKIRIQPFDYDPIRNEITTLTEFKLNIKMPVAVSSYEIKSKAFANFLRYQAINFDDMVNTSRMRQNERYLIIADPKFESGLQPFIDFRKKRFEVDLFTTNETGTTPGSIESFIDDRYNNESTRPAFLLFVGDTEEIPKYAWNKYEVPYGDVSGNGRYDMFMGRFSVSTVEELNNIVQKTMHFENNVKTYNKHLVMSSGVSNGIGGVMLEEGNDRAIDTFYQNAGYSWEAYRFNSNKSTTEEELVTAISKGPMVNMYAGHGGPTSWAIGDGKSLKVGEILDINNNSFYPVTYTHACLCGKYIEDICVGEAWTVGKGGGAIAFASYIETHFDYDDLLQDENHKALASGVTHIASAFVSALAVGGQHYAQYILFGDPALDFNPDGPVSNNYAIQKSISKSIKVTLDRNKLIVTGFKESMDLEIINLSGRLISKHKINKKGYVDFSSKELPKGIYIVKIKNGLAYHISRIVIR